MKRGAGLLFFISLAVFPPAAHAAAVDVTAKALQDHVTVGDEIRLVIQVERPRSFEAYPPAPDTNVKPFELKRVEAVPTLEGKNRIRQTFVAVLTIFELGDFKIPPIPIAYADASGHEGKVWTDPVPIKVASIGGVPEKDGKLHPIKGPVSLRLAALRNWIFGALAFILAVLLAALIVIRRRKKTDDDMESRLPAHERAHLEFERLKKSGLLGEGRLKEFYSGLSDILRRYLERRFKVAAIDLTTAEILSAMKELELPADAREKAKDVLENADLVKFAKYSPSRAITERVEEELLQVVDSTKPESEEAKK